eukprot:jgi/Chlat1/6932/Chrsp52S06602
MSNQASVWHTPDIHGTYGISGQPSLQQEPSGAEQLSALPAPSHPSLTHLQQASQEVTKSQARKCHKADREKLRRDRLNDKFAELATLLVEPGNPPKTDKASILGDSLALLNSLRAEINRLSDEQKALLSEQTELTQEKVELKQEKSVLKSETDLLQARIQAVAPWMAMSQAQHSAPQYAMFPSPIPPVPPDPAQAHSMFAMPSHMPAPYHYHLMSMHSQRPATQTQMQPLHASPAPPHQLFETQLSLRPPQQGMSTGFPYAMGFPGAPAAPTAPGMFLAMPPPAPIQLAQPQPAASSAAPPASQDGSAQGPTSPEESSSQLSPEEMT